MSGISDPLRVLAFSADRRWTVVAINSAPAGSAPVTLRLQFLGSDLGLLLPGDAVETSAIRNLEPVLPPISLPDRQLRASLPAQSITTFTLNERL